MTEILRGILGAVLFLFATNVWAVSPANPAAEALIREGIELRRLSDDQSALSKFEAAVKLDPTPRAVAQLGLCELAVGRFSHAVEHLTLAMRAGKDKWVASNKATLRESLEQAKSRIGRLEIAARPDGAEILVNGERVGTAPLSESIVTNEGAADVQVRLEGFVSQTRSFSIKGGQYQKIAFELERPGPTVDAPVPVLTPTEASPHDVSTNARPGWMAPTKWTLLGAAGLGLAVGTASWIRHQSLVDGFDKAGCQVNGDGDPGFVSPTDMFTVTQDCTARFAKVDDAGTWRTIGMAAGGAFLAAYVVVALLEPPSATTANSASRQTPTCGVSLATVVCSGKF